MDQDKIVCDFCSSPGVVWTYRALSCHVADMVIGGHRYINNSVGDWAACEECSKLIDKNDARGLIYRSVEMFEIQNGDMFPRELVVATVKAAHGAFWKVRYGDKIPISQTETISEQIDRPISQPKRG